MAASIIEARVDAEWPNPQQLITILLPLEHISAIPRKATTARAFSGMFIGRVVASSLARKGDRTRPQNLEGVPSPNCDRVSDGTYDFRSNVYDGWTN